jgi:hypothetical protein
VQDCAAEVALRCFEADRDSAINAMVAARVRRNESDLFDAFREFLTDSFSTEHKLRAAVGEAIELERRLRAERYVSRNWS